MVVRRWDRRRYLLLLVRDEATACQKNQEPQTANYWRRWVLTATDGEEINRQHTLICSSSADCCARLISAVWRHPIRHRRSHITDRVEGIWGNIDSRRWERQRRQGNGIKLTGPGEKKDGDTTGQDRTGRPVAAHGSAVFLTSHQQTRNTLIHIPRETRDVQKKMHALTLACT